MMMSLLVGTFRHRPVQSTARLTALNWYVCAKHGQLRNLWIQPASWTTSPGSHGSDRKHSGNLSSTSRVCQSRGMSRFMARPTSGPRLFSVPSRMVVRQEVSQMSAVKTLRGPYLFSLPGGIDVSRSTEAELPAVIDLCHRVGSGFATDTVPALFLQRVTNPNWFVISCYYQDKLICTSAVTVLDNGMTLNGLATRVDPKFQSKGLFHQLHAGYQPLVHLCYGCFPNWSQWFGLSTDPNSVKSVAKSKWGSTVQSRPILRISSVWPSEPPMVQSAAAHTDPLMPVSVVDIQCLATQPARRAQLWPAGVMVKNDLVYDVTIPEFDPKPCDGGVFAQREHGYRSTDCDVVSLGERLWCDGGHAWRYTINLYGESASHSQVLRHVQAHVPHACAPPHKAHLHLVLCLPSSCVQRPEDQETLVSGVKQILRIDRCDETLLMQSVFRVNTDTYHDAHMNAKAKL